MFLPGPISVRLKPYPFCTIQYLNNNASKSSILLNKHLILAFLIMLQQFPDRISTLYQLPENTRKLVTLMTQIGQELINMIILIYP